MSKYKKVLYSSLYKKLGKRNLPTMDRNHVDV